jgi:hypothetical protein
MPVALSEPRVWEGETAGPATRLGLRSGRGMVALAFSGVATAENGACRPFTGAQP